MKISSLANSNNQEFQLGKSANKESEVEIRIEQPKAVAQEPKMDKATKEKLEKTVESMNDFLAPAMTDLSFKLHEGLKEYYVQIVDSNTHEVVKEIPSKKMLDIHYEMEKFLGILIDEKI